MHRGLRRPDLHHGFRVVPELLDATAHRVHRSREPLHDQLAERRIDLALEQSSSPDRGSLFWLQPNVTPLSDIGY